MELNRTIYRRWFERRRRRLNVTNVKQSIKLTLLDFVEPTPIVPVPLLSTSADRAAVVAFAGATTKQECDRTERRQLTMNERTIDRSINEVVPTMRRSA
jgi:hypothetical protein